jgi:glycosyltransferase involved in cell wall biosynthesis
VSAAVGGRRQLRSKRPSPVPSVPPPPGLRTPGPGLRIYWGSPLPPTRSGVADYAAELLPHLAERADTTVLRPPDWSGGADAPWLRGLPTVVADTPCPTGVVPVLHLGNNPYHLWLVRRLRQEPAVVVLHDPVVHHLLVEEAGADRAWDRFAEELTVAPGEAGAALAHARRWGMTGLLDPFLFPAREVYLRHARAVIVHSEAAARAVAADCPTLPVRRVPLAVGAFPPGDRGAWRARLGASEDDLVLVHLGFLTPAKGLEVIVRALAALGELGVVVRLVVVGEGSEARALHASIDASGLGDRVTLWGWADEADVGGILAAADVGLVPRYPTAGETSAAVLRCLAAGTPAVVAGYAQFLEFPMAAAFRIPPGQGGVADLVRWLAALGASRAARETSRAAARQAWSGGRHDPAIAADDLVSVLEELVGELA